MTDKEWFFKMAELDYCQHMLFEIVKELNKNNSNSMNSPINQLIDNANGFFGVDWKTVALALYWCNEVITRKKALNINFEATEKLRSGLEQLMKKSGKEDFYNQVKNEIDNETMH